MSSARRFAKASRPYLKKATLVAAGVGTAASYRIDQQWALHERAKTDPSVNPMVAGRGDGLSGYAFTAYNNPPSVLEEPIVEYPTLSEALRALKKKGGEKKEGGDSESTSALPLVDVCVVGGGFAGLHTALALAEKRQKRTEGKKKKKEDEKSAGNDEQISPIVVLEANRIGSGASGLCGGMAIVGFEAELDMLSALVGPAAARMLYRQSIYEGYERLRDGVIRRYGIRCGMVEEGLLEMMLASRFTPTTTSTFSFSSCSDASAKKAVQLDEAAIEEEMRHTAAECAEEEKAYGQRCEVLSRGTIAAERGLDSERFAYGCFNPRTFSVNPLALVFGMARACVGYSEEEGANGMDGNGKRNGSSGSSNNATVSIYEKSRVVYCEREPLPPTALKKDGNLAALLASLEEGKKKTDTSSSDEAAVAEALRLAATYDKYGAGDFIVRTADGAALRAKEVVLATNAVPWELRPSLAVATTSCTTSIMLTRAFTDDADASAAAAADTSNVNGGGNGSVKRDGTSSVSIAGSAKAALNAAFSYGGCVIDERFGLVYFRRVSGDRVLFGGLASGSPFCPAGTGPHGGGVVLRGSIGGHKLLGGGDGATSTMSHAASRLADEFCRTFPTLVPHFLRGAIGSVSSGNNKDSNSSNIVVAAPSPVTECWEGRIEQRETMFPLVGRDPADGLWYSYGFSGHGVVPTCAAGEVVASAISSIVYPAAATTDSSAANTNAVSSDPSRLLEPADRRYELWREVSLFPSAAFKRARAALEAAGSGNSVAAGEGEAAATEPTQFPPLVYASSANALPFGLHRYVPVVMPPAGLPLTSVLPYIFIDYCLPLMEWWQGAK